jgi:pimeloyl-ACP methyl ester carboxylesterase
VAHASGEKGPFILVSHSISGLYARRFVARYPREVVGLVFVDSAHEEQALRLHDLDPRGPGLDDVTAQLGRDHPERQPSRAECPP